MGRPKSPRSPLFVIFTTVLTDLIGFGMVIPLISLYGREYGGTAFSLSILSSIYSLMQFAFAPLWGAASDRIGRRPIILISLLGSTLSYLIFALAPNLTWLIISRAFGGIFAANISAAQAYIADITTPGERARGMGLIGAAFGIGFTLGPPLGGIAATHFGLSAPGFLAAAICGGNFLLAIWRLPESLPPEARRPPERALSPLPLADLLRVSQRGGGVLLLTYFLVTFAFSNLEQTFSLLLQRKFLLTTADAGYKTGLVLMVSGLFGALLQGKGVRPMVKRFGEHRLLLMGLLSNMVAMAVFPFGPSYLSYFLVVLPLALGSSLVNPCLNALISQAARADEQGSAMGLAQGLGSLGRAVGPFCGLLTFAVDSRLPFFVGSVISLGLWLGLRRLRAFRVPLLRDLAVCCVMYLALSALPFGTWSARAEPSANAPLLTRRLILNWQPEPEFGGFYAASQGGHFAARGLNVKITPGSSGTPTLQMLAAGQADYAVSTADEIILARSRGMKVVAIFSVYQTNPIVILAHPERQFTGIKDILRGSGTLAVRRGMPFFSYLERRYGRPKVKVVPYPGGVSGFLHDPNYSQQGFIFSEPLTATRHGIKPQVFSVADEGFNPYMTVLTVREDFLQDHSSEVAGFVAAVRKGWQTYLDDPSSVNPLLLKLNSALSAEALGAMCEAQKPLITKGKSCLGCMDQQRWRSLIEQLTQIKLITPSQAQSVQPGECFRQFEGAT